LPIAGHHDSGSTPIGIRLHLLNVGGVKGCLKRSGLSAESVKNGDGTVTLDLRADARWITDVGRED